MKRIPPALATALALAAVLGTAAASAAPAADAPAPVPVSVSPQRATLAVGERVLISYRAELPAGASLAVETLFAPRLEGPSGEAGPLAEPEIPPPPRIEDEKATGKRVWTLAVPFTAFAPGEVGLPGPRLVLTSAAGEKTTFQGPAATLSVASRLPAEAKPETLEAKPDRPARLPRRGPWFWGLLAAGLILLAALVWLLVRWRRRKAPGALPGANSDLDPGQELAAALEALGRRVDGLGEDPRDFYSELTHVAKRYLERRTELPVLEWTTFETIRRLRDAGHEPPREVGLAELLGSADRVKFGRASSTREEAGRQLERARLLLEHVETSHKRHMEEAEARAASMKAKGAGR